MHISGVMPKWRRYYHAIATGFMCLLFVGIGVMNGRFALAPATGRPNRGIIFVSFLFIVLACFGVGGQFWFRRRVIDEFSFDGRALRFRTLGIPEIETRDISEITQLREWRGRGAPLGYRLTLRGGRKLYLEYSVSMSTALAEQIQQGLRNEASR
ncbi:MAG TPA: hypothetical protein VN841_02475 [Bryobacteraceae bacterium]|nr:hypothetical protein [Bryobacteraceae bacterium]